MRSLRTRTARLAGASALALGLGVVGAGPALSENPAGWGCSVPDSSFTFAADDDASLTGLGRPGGIKSADDDASGDAAPLSAAG